jgi:hypothetical protein
MPVLHPASTGITVPGSFGTPAGSESADQSTSSGAEAGPSKGPAKPGKGEAKGKAKGKGKASNAQQGSTLSSSSSSQAPAAVASGTTAVAVEEPQADRELQAKTHDGRGLVLAALRAWALAIDIHCQHGRGICLGAWLMTSVLASHMT